MSVPQLNPEEFYCSISEVREFWIREIICNSLPNDDSTIACMSGPGMHEWTREGKSYHKKCFALLVMVMGRQVKYFWTAHTTNRMQHTASCCSASWPWQNAQLNAPQVAVTKKTTNTSEDNKADLHHIYNAWQAGNLNGRLSQDPLLVLHGVKGLQIHPYQQANVSELLW